MTVPHKPGDTLENVLIEIRVARVLGDDAEDTDETT